MILLVTCFLLKRLITAAIHADILKCRVREWEKVLGANIIKFIFYILTNNQNSLLL